MADHAIVIGINEYPGIGDLDGACNDAQAFRDWLVAVEGGGLEETSVKLILSADYPATASVENARPWLDDIQTALRPLLHAAGSGHHQTGRLFLFAAGHGFADSSDERSCALFTANAEPRIPLYLALTHYASWFVRNWAFDEVIMIMDCCRDTNPLLQIVPPQLLNTNHHQDKRTKAFSAFATEFRAESREREIDGKPRGIFTCAFLDALENAPSNRLGRVTGSAVRDYVHNVLDRFAGNVGVTPPVINADDRRDVLFATRKVKPTLPVRFQLVAGHTGREMVIFGNARKEVHRQTVGVLNPSVDLEPGFYKVEIEGAGLSQLFEVPHNEKIII